MPLVLWHWHSGTAYSIKSAYARHTPESWVTGITLLTDDQRLKVVLRCIRLNYVHVFLSQSVCTPFHTFSHLSRLLQKSGVSRNPFHQVLCPFIAYASANASHRIHVLIFILCRVCIGH